MQRFEKLKKWNDTFVPLAIGSLTVLSASWAADAISSSISALLSKNSVRFDWLNTIYILLFFVMVFFCIPWLKNRYYWPRLRRRMIKSVTAEKRRHLIIFLSPASIPDWLKLSTDIQQDIEFLAQKKKVDQSKRWQWEMPLRAIAFHSDGAKLKSITMICSKKTIKHVHAFRKVLSNYQNVLGGAALNIMVKQDNRIRSVSITGPPEQPIGTYSRGTPRQLATAHRHDPPSFFSKKSTNL